MHASFTAVDAFRYAVRVTFGTGGLVVVAR